MTKVDRAKRQAAGSLGTGAIDPLLVVFQRSCCRVVRAVVPAICWPSNTTPTRRTRRIRRPATLRTAHRLVMPQCSKRRARPSMSLVRAAVTRR